MAAVLGYFVTCGNKVTLSVLAACSERSDITLRYAKISLTAAVTQVTCNITTL